MKLNYKQMGVGKPLIILHGLFGSLDNWQTLGNKFAEHFAVYLVDLRNHGHSPHSDEWNYELMCDDLLELINDCQLGSVLLLGHSLGGKVAMQFALSNPTKVEKLIVADIAPKEYAPHHTAVLKAIHSVDLAHVKSRKEADESLVRENLDIATRQFLLKNLYWADEISSRLDWRFNLSSIEKNIGIVGKQIVFGQSNNLPCLFLRGSKSNYITDNDMDEARKLFPHAELKTIENAGHWLHAEQPALFYEAVIGFLNT